MENSTLLQDCLNSSEDALSSVAMNASNFSMNYTGAFLRPAKPTINHSERVGVAVMFLITSILAIGGNLMVILAVVRSKQLRTTTNAFVVCLSAANLATALALPWSVVGLLSWDGWPMSTDVPCYLAGLLLMTSVGASMYSLTGIAISRVLSISAQPSVYLWWFTPRKLAIMITAIWLLPFLIVLIPPLCDVGKLGYDESVYTCTDVAEHPRLHHYRLAVALVFYPFPVLAIITSYSIILVTIRRKFRHQRKLYAATANQPSHFDWGAQHESRKSRLSQQQLSITVNLFINVCIFLLLNLPLGFALLLPQNNRRTIFTGMLFFMHTFVHPILYGVKHPQFKQAFRQMLGLTIDKAPSSGSVYTRNDGKQTQRSSRNLENGKPLASTV